MIDLATINHSEITFEWFQSKKKSLAIFFSLGKIAIIPSNIFIFVVLFLLLAKMDPFCWLLLTCLYVFVVALYIIYLRSSKMIMILKLKIENNIKESHASLLSELDKQKEEIDNKIKEYYVSLLSKLDKQREEIDEFIKDYPIYYNKDNDIYKDVKEYFLGA